MDVTVTDEDSNRWDNAQFEVEPCQNCLESAVEEAEDGKDAEMEKMQNEKDAEIEALQNELDNLRGS